MLLRTRITWLAAALVAGVVASFVIPLALLMRTMAEDRAVAETRSREKFHWHIMVYYSLTNCLNLKELYWK